MRKVKIFQSDYVGCLENYVNSFIEGLDVLDIQFRMSCTNHNTYYSAMIVYEE